MVLSIAATAAITPYSAAFRTQDVQTNGTTLHVRIGGGGPAVILLHGFGDTGDMWVPLAANLAKDHTVIVPDLRGMGLSGHPDTGYAKKNQAVDIAGVKDAVKAPKADMVTHDIGNMVGTRLRPSIPTRSDPGRVIDAPLPCVGNWDKFLLSPMLWHFKLVRLFDDGFESGLTCADGACDVQRRLSLHISISVWN